MQTKTLELAGCVISDKENGLLLLHRNSPQKTHWELPGGKLNAGESPQEAAVRELHEELGIEVKIIKKLGSAVFFEDEREMHYHWFEAVLTGGIPTLQEPLFDEVAYISWEEIISGDLIISNNLKKLAAFHTKQDDLKR